MLVNMSKYSSWLTQAFFVVSMLSGVIIAFAYYPSNAYESVQKLNYIIPFGLFFRELHYFSSEIFTILLLVHIMIEIYKKNIKISFKSWTWAVLATIVVFILMFTGFILKADLGGNAAAQVAFTLIKDTPLLDNTLYIFKDTEVFYWKFFIWHIIFLPLLLSLAIYKHVKKISVNIRYFTIALAVTLFVSYIMNMPSDIALDTQPNQMASPWFFVAAEHLLQMGLNSISINIILALPFIFLLFIYKDTYKKLFSILLFLWVLLYAYFSI